MPRPAAQALKDLYPEAGAFEFIGSNSTNALLLIHGFTGTPAEMRPIATLVHEKLQWTCKGILLKGHATFPHELSCATLEDWQSQVAGAILELKKNYAHVHLCGLSMGGLLAMDYALEHAQDLTSLSLFAPAIKVRSIQWAVDLLGFLKLSPRLLFPKAPSQEPDHVSYRSYNLAGLKQFNRLQRRVLKNLKDIRLPTAIIYSQADETIEAKGIERILSRFSNSRNKITSLSVSGHIVTLGKEKTTTLEKAIEFYSQF